MITFRFIGTDVPAAQFFDGAVACGTYMVLSVEGGNGNTSGIGGAF